MNRFWWFSFLTPFVFRMAEAAGGAPAAGGEGGTAGGAPPAGILNNGGGAPAADDRAWLGEYSKEPAFANFKTPADVAKSYKNGLEKWGDPASLLKMPKADAPPEAWDSVWKQLGRPDTPDKYELKAPDGLTISPKLDKAAREAFHKAGVPAKAAQAVYEQFTAAQKAEYDGLMAERKAEGEKTVTTFKAKWGDKFDAEMGMAETAYKHLLSPGLKKMFEATGLDSHPDMIALMNKLGHTLKEDIMLGGTGGSGTQGRDFATVKAERVKVHEEVIKMKDPMSPMYKEKNAQLQKLMAEEANLKFANEG